MNYITESELREMWQNGREKLPNFPPDTRLSMSAQDFIKANGIELTFSPEARVDSTPSNLPNWYKPGTFPVNLTGPLPVCQECGQPVEIKPDYLTQIDAGHYGKKTDPRLILRGRIDSLHALVMLTAEVARRYQLPEMAYNLDILAAYCREIMSAEYNMRTVASLTLMGKSEDELHEISHWPEKYLGIPHIVPGAFDPEIIHWLNLLRTQAREVEIVVIQAFQPNMDSSKTGSSLAHALNRLSSAVYFLELYFKAGVLSWKMSG